MVLEVRGRARLEASLADLEELRYRIDVEQILAVYRGIALGATSPFVLEGNRDGFSVSELTLVGEDTAIGIDGVVPLSRDGSVILHARGASRERQRGRGGEIAQPFHCAPPFVDCSFSCTSDSSESRRSRSD